MEGILKAVFVFLLIFIFTIILITLFLISKLINKNRQLERILKQYERYQRQYIDNANTQYDTVRKMRHDLKNQFNTAYTLIEDNKIDEAKIYLSHYSDILMKSAPIIKTDNSIANAIINSKLAAASDMGIHVSCFSVNDFYGIDDIDLCNLLSNTLENAITACNDNIRERFISVNIDKEESIYTFIIKNSIKRSVLKENPKLITTKTNKKEHGYGTKIIKDIAQKYNGRCDFYETNNMFCCKVTLRIN